MCTCFRANEQVSQLAADILGYVQIARRRQSDVDRGKSNDPNSPDCSTVRRSTVNCGMSPKMTVGFMAEPKNKRRAGESDNRDQTEQKVTISRGASGCPDWRCACVQVFARNAGSCQKKARCTVSRTSPLSQSLRRGDTIGGAPSQYYTITCLT